MSSNLSQSVVSYLDVRNPFSVSVFEDHVYWSTQEKGEVFRQDKFGRGTKTKLLTAGPWLTQISVFQQQRYNSVASKTVVPTHTLLIYCHNIHTGTYISHVNKVNKRFLQVYFLFKDN